MFGYLRDMFSSKEELELADIIIESLKNEPLEWNIGDCTARKGRLSIWIANSPYADMRINDRRLPKRPQLRKALAQACMFTNLSLAKKELTK